MPSFLKRQTPAQAAVLLTLINLLSKPLGVVREAVIASRFGQSAQRDAYRFSQNLPTIFGGLVAGALISSFMPIFVRVKETKGEEKAWELASRVFTLLLIVLSVGCLLLFFFARPVTRIMAPGLNTETFELTVTLTRYLIPLVFFGTLLGLFTAIFNAYQHFLLPRLAELLNNIFLIAAVLVLFSALPSSQKIASLIIGNIASILLQFFLVGGFLLRRKPFLRLNFRWKGDVDLAQVFKLLLPLVIGGSAGVLNLLVDGAFSSALPVGTPTALQNATTIMGIPQAMFVGNVATAIYPTLLLHVARQALDDFRRSLGHGLNALWYVIIPSSAGLVALAYPIIAVVFERGDFTPANTALTAPLLALYSLGLFAHGGNALLGNGFVALGDTATPTILGFCSVAANFFLCLLLSHLMGARGLALATTLVAFLNFLGLLLLLQRKLKSSLMKGLWIPLGKTVLASVMMALACYASWQGLVSALHPAGWGELGLLVLLIVAGIALYALLSRLLRIPEFNRYLNYLLDFRKKLSRLWQDRHKGGSSSLP